MTSKSSMRRVLVVLAAALAIPLSILAQADSTLYMAVDCMKSTSPDYVNVETEIWQPMHQELVNQGRKLSWALLGVDFGSRAECDYYTVNRYMGAAALDGPYDNLGEIFEKVHPDANMADAMMRTGASRELVWTHLYIVVGGIPPKSFEYVHVNRMKAEDGGAYVDHEMSVFKPVHQALIDDGITKGWVVYALVSPNGSKLGFNFGTADFADHVGPIPFGGYMAKVHPDADMQEIFAQTETVRDLVLHETWRLIARTTDKSMSDE